MVRKYLGLTIDIHGGGNDLVFPHHENEIAQSESCNDAPLARYWLHNGMLQLRGEKMSKSLGNMVTISQFLQDHDADVFRLLVLSSHYRKPLAYDDEVVEQAERALARLRGGLKPPQGDITTGDAVEQLQQAVLSARQRFIAAMDDDFNSAGALGHLYDLVKAINQARDQGVGGPPFAGAQQTLGELASSSSSLTCATKCAASNNGPLPTPSVIVSKNWA